MKTFLGKLGITDAESFKAFVFQFIRFGIVGVSNTLIFFVIYYPFLFIGVHYIIANFVAFVIATLNSFFLNRKFVFKKADGKKSAQLTRVFFAYGFTVSLSTVMLFLLIDIFGISQYIAPLITFCFTIPTNFLLNKFWAFRTQKESSSKED